MVMAQLRSAAVLGNQPRSVDGLLAFSAQGTREGFSPQSANAVGNHSARCFGDLPRAFPVTFAGAKRLTNREFVSCPVRQHYFADGSYAA